MILDNNENVDCQENRTSVFKKDYVFWKKVPEATQPASVLPYGITESTLQNQKANTSVQIASSDDNESS